MKRNKLLISISSLALVLVAAGIGVTSATMVDLEISNANNFQAWTSSVWTQTTQADFAAGVLSQVDTASSPGNVVLASGVGSDWYNSSWPCRRAITIDHTRVTNVFNPSSTYASFPVLISLSSNSDLAADAQDDGDDILFTSSDGTTKLPLEIESFSGTTGQLAAWVKVTLTKDSSDSTNDVIYMYYGNASCSSQQDATNVWNPDYKGVWHLKEDASGTGYLETLRPNAAGDETSIASQYPSSTQHWDKVDEATQDDSSTYVYTASTSYQRDLYNLPDNTASGTINSITVYFRFYSPSTTYSARAKAAIKTNGTVYDGTEKTMTNGWANASETWTTNPNTGTAWTWDQVDALQAGVSLRTTSSSAPARCTQVYVEVAYNLYTDSTSNQNSGQDLVSSTDKTGKIGSGQGFDGSDDWINPGNDASLQVTTVTVEAWCKPNTTSVYMGIGGKLQDTSDAGFALSKVDTNKFRFQTATGGVSTTIDSNSTYGDTNWHYVVGVRTGGTNYLYVDGVQQTQTSTASIADSGNDAHIGRQYIDYDGRWWNGVIDEFRISSTGRSSGWIGTCYNNQNSPSSFCLLGGEEHLTLYLSSGTLASQVLDTGVSGARWDGIFWTRMLPASTGLTMAVRASNTLFAKDTPPGTLPWTAVGGTSPVTSGLPAGRYMQWQVTLTTSDTSTTPSLSDVSVYHY